MSFGNRNGQTPADQFVKYLGSYSGETACNTLAPTDPAAMRHHVQGILALNDRLICQLNRLRDIADCVLGPEALTPEPKGCSSAPFSVGGVTASIMGAFEGASSFLNDIDRQIERLQRISG